MHKKLVTSYLPPPLPVLQNSNQQHPALSPPPRWASPAQEAKIKISYENKNWRFRDWRNFRAS